MRVELSTSSPNPSASVAASPARPFALASKIDLILLVALGLAMLARTWKTWPDAFIDFGDQAYLPWRIVEGSVLYRDLPYDSGALPPYFNATLFALFGTSLNTLFAVNLLVLAAIAWLLHRLVAGMAGRLAAVAAVAIFLLVFAFGQYVPINNYNYLAPYRHDMTHGLLFGLVGILGLWRFCRDGKARWAALAGMSLGCAFLTKAEMFAAAAAAALAGWILIGACRGRRGPFFRALGLYALSALLPFAGLAVVNAHFGADWAWALRAVEGSWPATLGSSITRSPFYLESTGFDLPRQRITQMVILSSVGLVLLAPGAGMAYLTPKFRRWRWPLIAGSAAAWGWMVWLARDRVFWFGLPIALPVAVASIAIAWTNRLSKRRAESRDVLMGTFIVFAAALLAKMILNARIHHYGFVLAMPATMLCVASLFAWIPRWLERKGGDGAAFAACAAAVAFVGAVIFWEVQDVFIEANTHRVGQGGDQFFGDSTAPIVNAAATEIAKRSSPTQSLAVIPDGTMINYLARRANRTPYLHFMPTEVADRGEAKVIEDLRRSPPDFIALVHRDTSEFGPRYFGHDYGQKIAAWLGEAYHPVWLAGALPFSGPRFGILILQRNSSDKNSAQPTRNHP